MLPWVITVIVILVGIVLLEISYNENSGLKKKVRSLKDRNDELEIDNRHLHLEIQELKRKKINKIKEEIKKKSSNKLSDSKRSAMVSYIRDNRHRCIHQIDSRAYASDMYAFDDTVLELLYYQVMNNQPYSNEIRSPESDKSSDYSSISSSSSDYSSGSSSHSHSSSYDNDYSSSSSSGWDSSSSSYDSGSSGGDW